jgi:hypothetical protein
MARIKDSEICHQGYMMVGTLYGYVLALHKRDVDWAYQKMSTKEKVDFKQKLAEINKAEADDGQSLPPSLTPL